MQQKSRMKGMIIMLMILPFCVSAQYEIKALPRWLTNFQIGSMIPQPPVDKFLDDGSTAFQFEFQYRLQYNKPFLGGVYFGETGLSKYVLEYIWNSPDGDVEVREKANTRRIDFGLTAGFYPEINWLLQPYLQGRVGMAVFQSSSILTNADTEENIDRISEMTSSVLSYGLDFGIHIVPNIWYIRGDVRVGFVANPSVTFLSLDEENAGTSGYPIDYFEEHTSAGSWLKLSVGVSYLF
jgi:hypothetical protein